MPSGGKRKNAGRKRRPAALIPPNGTDPIAFLHAIMEAKLLGTDGKLKDNKDITLTMRKQAAVDILPYLYPRLSSVQANVDPIDVVHRIITEIVDSPKSGS